MEENQEKVWDEIATEWNRYREEVSPSVKEFFESMSGKVLDLGCGSGRNFIKKEDILFYGVDFSEKMLKLAEKNAKKLGINIELKKANVWDTNYPDNYFDSVLCFAVLHCLDTKKKRQDTLKEIFRVIKKGGEALISSWGPKSPRLKNKGKECFVPWTVKGKTKIQRYTYVFDLEELIRLVESVGFKVVRAWEERNVNVIVKKP